MKTLFEMGDIKHSHIENILGKLPINIDAKEALSDLYDLAFNEGCRYGVDCLVENVMEDLDDGYVTQSDISEILKSWQAMINVSVE